MLSATGERPAESGNRYTGRPMPSNESNGELDLRGYLSVIRRRTGIIAISVLVVAGASVAYSVLQTPVYRASVEVLLQTSPSQAIINQGQQQQNAQFLQEQVQTEIQLMQSRSVRDAAAKKLGYEPKIKATAKGATQVVVISSEDPDRAKAMREASTYGQTYVDVRRQATSDDLLNAATKIRSQMSSIDDQAAKLNAQVNGLNDLIATTNDSTERQRLSAQRDQLRTTNASQLQNLQDRRSAYAQQLDQLQLTAALAQSSGAQIVSAPQRPTSPVSPKPVRDAAIALVLGLAIGVGLAFLFEYLDDRIRTKDDLDQVSGGVTVLGLVPSLEGWKDRRSTRLVSMSEPNSPAAEAYRAVRTSIQFLAVERPIKLIQVTSPSAAEGKTTTLANLGVALAGAGREVVIVDCDLRRPRLHQFFGLENPHGLTSVMLGDDRPNDVFQAVPGVSRLSIVASGPPPPNPSELLSTRAAQAMLRAFGDHADYVLIDSPPLLPVADAVVLAGIVDATILVVDASSTTKRALVRSLELLRQVDAPLAGAVLNGVGSEAAYAYGYGGYAYGYAPSKPSRRERRASGSSTATPKAGRLPASTGTETSAERGANNGHGGGDDAAEDSGPSLEHRPR
ncbi:MAG: hypothetical protein JWN46_1745 [Acidimicrobiales bacterium]|nr:hypothetical protein [Acidimicrobiales bacterium]